MAKHNHDLSSILSLMTDHFQSRHWPHPEDPGGAAPLALQDGALGPQPLGDLQRDVPDPGNHHHHDCQVGKLANVRDSFCLRSKSLKV